MSQADVSLSTFAPASQDCKLEKGTPEGQDLGASDFLKQPVSARPFLHCQGADTDTLRL